MTLKYRQPVSFMNHPNTTKHAQLVDETATTSGEEHVVSPPKVSKVKDISAKGLKAAPKQVPKKCNTPNGSSISS